MSDNPERPAAQGSMTGSDRDESPTLEQQSFFERQYPPAILDLINTFREHSRLESNPNSSRAERAAVEPPRTRLGSLPEAVVPTRSVEQAEPESFEVPIMLDDPTYRAASHPVPSRNPRSTRVPVSPIPESIRLPASPSSTFTPVVTSLSPASIRLQVSSIPADNVTTPSPDTVPLTRGASFASRFGQPGSSLTPAPWPESAVPYSSERMLEAWLIRQQLLAGIPIDQLQPMTNPGQGRTHRTPPWIIITPDGAHIVSIPPARFHGVMQPIPRVPWLPAPSTTRNPPAASNTPATSCPAEQISPELSSTSVTSTSSAGLSMAAENTRNMRSNLEMHHRLATARLIDSVAPAGMITQAASPTLAVPSAPTLDPRPHVAEVCVNSLSSAVSSPSPVVVNQTLAKRSTSGTSTMRNPRSVRSGTLSPELSTSVPPGVTGPRMAMRTNLFSTVRDPRLRLGAHAPASTSSVSSAPRFTILDQRLVANRHPSFGLSALKDPRPSMTLCRFTNVAIWSGHLLAYPPRPRRSNPTRPRPMPLNPPRGSLRRPDEENMGDTHRTDNATPGGSTPAEDVPLQVTREVSDDPSNNQRETPFGGGDGCWSPLPTLVLLDNEIGEDEVVPDPEGTETPGEISNFQIHWFPERPVIIPKYFPDSPREVWSFSSPPMEPLFMQVLTDDLGIWTRMNAHKSSSLNISENDGSDDVSVLVRVKNITVLTLQSPNEAVRGESSLPLGDSLVEIYEIVALITDYLTRKDLEALAITSTTLRKMCHP